MVLVHFYYALVMILLENFLASYEALHIVHFRTISDEMKKMIQNAEYPRDDPRRLNDLASRQEICDQVLQARQYVTLNSHNNRDDANPTREQSIRELTADADNFQRLRSTSRDTLPSDQSVAYYKNEGRWETRALPLIQCVGKNKVNWYVGFDQHHEERMYLVQRTDFPSRVLFKWIALIERAGLYNNIYSGPKTRENLFQHFVEEVKSDKKRRDLQKSLCFLSLNEHGRLCSAVSESLNLKLAPRELGRFNYVNTSQKRCTTKLIEVSDNEIIRARVIQCTINRARARPQFYVLGDRKVRGTGYVLTHKAGIKLHKLLIIARVQNLNVLREFRSYENKHGTRRKVITIW